MNAICKRFVGFLVSVLVVAAAGLVPSPAPAQIGGGVVVCVNCSEKATQAVQLARQILQYAKQVEQYTKQVEQYLNQVERLKDQLKNSVKITSPIFDSALQTIRSIENTMSSARNISYTWANLDWSFRYQFTDLYTEYDRIYQLDNSWDAMQYDFERSERTYDAALQALKAARDHSFSLNDDQYRMDQVGWQLTDASGRLDALQAAGEYAQMSAQQLMKMRQIALIQLQMMAQAQADEQQRYVTERASLETWITDRPADATRTGNTSGDYRR